MKNCSYKFLAVCFLQLSVLISQAQDSTGTAGTLTSETSWYTETWIWMAGAAVSILLILALVRWSTNKKRTDN